MWPLAGFAFGAVVGAVGVGGGNGPPLATSFSMACIKASASLARPFASSPARLARDLAIPPSSAKLALIAASPNEPIGRYPNSCIALTSVFELALIVESRTPERRARRPEGPE